jgi:hypothetical protein
MRANFASVPGSDEKPNEDAVFASGQALIVVDGVTAPGGLNTGCVHGTPWYANNLATLIGAVVTEKTGIELRVALAQALSDVAESHRDTCDLDSDGTPSGTVAILRISSQTLDYLVLSDATAIIETVSGVKVITDKRVDEVVTDLAEAAKAAPAGTPERKARLAEFVTEQRKHRNVIGGYWLAGALPEAAEHALGGSVPLSEVRRAALMTDGAAALVDLYGRTTWEKAPSELENNGPAQWIERVRQAERDDASAVRWPRFKRGDDATVAYMEPAVGRC